MKIYTHGRHNNAFDDIWRYNRATIFVGCLRHDTIPFYGSPEKCRWKSAPKAPSSNNEYNKPRSCNRREKDFGFVHLLPRQNTLSPWNPFSLFIDNKRNLQLCKGALSSINTHVFLNVHRMRNSSSWRSLVSFAAHCNEIAICRRGVVGIRTLLIMRRYEYWKRNGPKRSSLSALVFPLVVNERICFSCSKYDVGYE